MIAIGYATNKLTNDRPQWWWWVVLAVSAVAFLAAGVWTYFSQKANDNGPEQPSSKVINQTTGPGGANVKMSANNNGVAVWQVETLNIGERPNDDGGASR
jgi:hypothetical protein